jgi:ribosome-associated protein
VRRHALSPSLSLAPEDLQFRYLRARGPGGQNVNKVATAVQLRFDLEATRTLPDAVKARLRQLAGRRLTSQGEILIAVDTHRTQAANRAEAVARLCTLIERARVAPKTRIATRPSAGSAQRRLERKHHQQRTKRLRRAPSAEE